VEPKLGVHPKGSLLPPPMKIKKEDFNMKKLVIIFLTMFLLAGCATQKQIVNSKPFLTPVLHPRVSLEGPLRLAIIEGKKENIVQALVAMGNERLAAYVVRQDVEMGYVVLVHRDFWRGDIAIDIYLKKAIRKTNNGELKGYFLVVTTRGVGFNRSLTPGYGVGWVIRALPPFLKRFDCKLYEVIE